MRRILLAGLAIAAIFAAAPPINRAQAMTPAAPSQLGVANTTVGFEKTAWGCGWHGCVPGWHRYYRSYPISISVPVFRGAAGADLDRAGTMAAALAWPVVRTAVGLASSLLAALVIGAPRRRKGR